MLKVYVNAIVAGVIAGTALICIPSLVREIVVVLHTLISHNNLQGEECGDLAFVVQAIVVTPLVIAIAGALTIKLSSSWPMSDSDCMILSEIAGLAAVASAMSLLLALASIRLRHIELLPAGDETVFGSMARTMAPLDATAGILACSVFAIHGGLLYRAWGSMRSARA